MNKNPEPITFRTLSPGMKLVVLADYRAVLRWRGVPVSFLDLVDEDPDVDYFDDDAGNRISYGSLTDSDRDPFEVISPAEIAAVLKEATDD